MSRSRHLAQLRESAPAVLPSLLQCDFGNLEREIRELEEAGVGALHLDVMDGRFVPNLTYGFPILEACRRATQLPLDVHLMIEEPQRYISRFVEAGADLLTIHVEAVHNDAIHVLREIRELDCAAGITLNPDTPVEAIEDCLEECDLVLVMSVEPGFGGQSFRSAALDKLRRLRELVGDDVLLEIDGGVNDGTVRDCVAAGAELLVVGSALFRNTGYTPAVRKLTELASQA